MIWVWVAFIAFVLVMLALDLFVVNRHAHVIRSREALLWTGFTVILSLAFSVFVYFAYQNNWFGIAEHLTRELAKRPHPARSIGLEATIQYIAGWLTEYSLSLDNIFVIAVIFRYFSVPAQHQRRVLLWGVLGALVMRGVMIGVGATLIERFHPTIYILGALLIITAFRMLLTGDEEPHPDRNIAVRVARKFFPVTSHFEGERFFTRLPATDPVKPGRLAMTPLFIVLLVVETTDVLFAVDSIPAIFAITTDPFLVFTSNVFALLGLRSLYFALAAFMDKFRYLKTSLVFVLAFVGVKMILSDIKHIPTTVSLAVIVGALGLGIGASLLHSSREKRRELRPAPVTDLAEAAEEAWRRSRRYIIFVIGITIVGIGLAFGAIPGPGGIPIVLAGLAILATEFLWARRLLQYTRRKAEETLQKQGPWALAIGAVMILLGIVAIAFHGTWHIRARWAIPFLISGAAIIGTEVVYNRILKRKKRAEQSDAKPGEPTPQVTTTATQGRRQEPAA